MEPSCPACHGTQGAPAALPVPLPASSELSHVQLTAEERDVCFPVFLHGEKDCWHAGISLSYRVLSVPHLLCLPSGSLAQGSPASI